MHNSVWHTPQPLWPKALEDAPSRTRFHRPELLRFATDTFMDDVQATLAADAEGIADLVARAETWRNAEAGWIPHEDFDANDVLKLYQPVHQRFYLVSASLVCQVRGLPDKTVDAANEEASSFVLRRLKQDEDGQLILDENASGYEEYGWFGDSVGWKPVTDPRSVDTLFASEDGALLTEREERLPLFPLNYPDPGLGKTRRLLAGLVPVGGREAYESAPRADAPPINQADLDIDALRDPRLGDYERDVVYGLLPLHELVVDAPSSLEDEDLREPFVFALLDLLRFLERYLPDVLNAIKDDNSSGLSPVEEDVFDTISNLDNHGVSPALLTAIYSARNLFDEGTVDLSDGATPGHGLNDLVSLTQGQINAAIVAFNGLRINNLEYDDEFSLNLRVREALGAYTGEYTTNEPLATPNSAAKTGADVGSVYVIRCVYERPRCKRYGRLPLVSARSQPFRLAGFFDSDAPVRPTRIAMPVDTSISGLRKYPKAVSFLISDQLRAQLERVNGIKLEALDKGEIGDEGGWTLGMICSLSIPIITICAFILLLIIVFVLNIVFWWIPFFRICFPIPLKK